MEHGIIDALTSFGIGGGLRVLGMVILGGISGSLSRKVFLFENPLKTMLLYAFLSLGCFGLAYLIAIPFFKHPMSIIGFIALWLPILAWIRGLWDKRFD